MKPIVTQTQLNAAHDQLNSMFISCGGARSAATYLDAVWADGKPVMRGPNKDIPHVRWCAYVPSQKKAKEIAEALEKHMSMTWTSDQYSVPRFNPHHQWYGKGAGRWKVEAYINAELVQGKGKQ